MYNNRNKLKLIAEVQAEYLLHENSGLTTRAIYKKFIYPRFYISIATLYNYLAVPVKREMKKLDTKPNH